MEPAPRFASVCCACPNTKAEMAACNLTWLLHACMCMHPCFVIWLVKIELTLGLLSRFSNSVAYSIDMFVIPNPLLRISLSLLFFAVVYDLPLFLRQACSHLDISLLCLLPCFCQSLWYCWPGTLHLRTHRCQRTHTITHISRCRHASNTLLFFAVWKHPLLVRKKTHGVCCCHISNTLLFPQTKCCKQAGVTH